MVPIPPLPLFQIFSVIILKPVSQRFLEAPLKLITAVFQLLTTDISRNLELLHFRRTDTHWRAKKHGSSSHRHDNPVRNIRHKLSQSCYLLHSLYNILNGISRFEATVIQLNTMFMMFQTIQHEANQLLYIDDCSDSMVPITTLHVIPIQRYRNLVVLLGIYYSLMLHLVQTGTIEDVISQYKTSRIITDKLFTNDEKLSQTIW